MYLGFLDYVEKLIFFLQARIIMEIQKIQKIPEKVYFQGITVLIIFVVFYQMVSDLVEGIYTLDLLNTKLDAKAAGMLFFLTGALLWLIPKRNQHWWIRGILGIMMISRVVEPFMDPTGKIVSAGIAVGCFWLGFPLYISLIYNEYTYMFMNDGAKGIIKTQNGKETKKETEKWQKTPDNLTAEILTFALAGASLFIISFKTWGATLDLSVIRFGQIIGFLMVIGGIYFITITTTAPKMMERNLSSQKITILSMLIMLSYFALNSPGIFTRWSEANYTAVITLICISIVSFLIILLWSPSSLFNMPKWMVFAGNCVFFIFLILGILSNQTSFIANVNASPVIVQPSTFLQKFWIYLACILTFFLYTGLLQILSKPIVKKEKEKQNYGIWLINGFLFVLWIFIFIFTNVWGYVKPVSLWFRGLFWLPFVYIGVIFLAILSFSMLRNLKKSKKIDSKKIFIQNSNFWGIKKNLKLALSAVFLILLLTNGIRAFSTESHPIIGNNTDNPLDSITSLRILTYNVQQGANVSGDKNFEQQLALIQEINPDLIGLQESDTPKINTGNSDLVRYFADSLNYYVYYGPKTVMQTYGVAILSRYPIQNFYSIYTYGDEDEIGSLFAEVLVGNKTLNVMVNHPAGSADAKAAHTEMMLDQVSGLTNVILMGDFNWREDSMYYSSVTAVYQDSWRTKWPTGIDNKGISMQSTIDHIFLSPTFIVESAHYIPSPQSQTDHPAYWIEISW